MNIRSFTTTSPVFPSVCFEQERPICFFSGASSFLHMMRCLLDGVDDGNPIDREKARSFESRVRFELDQKEYELCGVLCQDRTFFVAVDTENGFSEVATAECLKRLRASSGDVRSLYSIENRYVKNDNYLSDSDYSIENFKKFLEIVKEETKKGDRRPIYIFNFFDRVDEAVDSAPFLEELSALGRQVFVSVSKNYPTERMTHRKVQSISFNA